MPGSLPAEERVKPLILSFARRELPPPAPPPADCLMESRRKSHKANTQSGDRTQKLTRRAERVIFCLAIGTQRRSHIAGAFWRIFGVLGEALQAMVVKDRRGGTRNWVPGLFAGLLGLCSPLLGGLSVSHRHRPCRASGRDRRFGQSRSVYRILSPARIRLRPLRRAPAHAALAAFGGAG